MLRKYLQFHGSRSSLAALWTIIPSIRPVNNTISIEPTPPHHRYCYCIADFIKRNMDSEYPGSLFLYAFPQSPMKSLNSNRKPPQRALSSTNLVSRLLTGRKTPKSCKIPKNFTSSNLTSKRLPPTFGFEI